MSRHLNLYLYLLLVVLQRVDEADEQLCPVLQRHLFSYGESVEDVRLCQLVVRTVRRIAGWLRLGRRLRSFVHLPSMSCSVLKSTYGGR